MEIYLIIKYVWVEQIPMGGNKEFCSVVGACMTKAEGSQIVEMLNKVDRDSKYQYELKVVSILKATDKINTEENRR